MTALHNKHALVTGGGTGTGKAIAYRLLQLGARVTITGRRSEPLIDVAGAHENINWLSADVTDSEAMAEAVATACRDFGQVDIAVANAGVADSKPFIKLTSADMQTMLNVNVLGVFNTFQAVLPSMLESQSGRMIAVASTAGLKGYRYVAHYCAAKHAVVGMVKALSLELARKGITVNAICPSYIDTEMTSRTVQTIMQKTGMTEAQAVTALVADNPLGRLITTDEVADTVAWLSSEGASAINGQAVSVSGGEV